MINLKHERLIHLLDYSEQTGLFTRRVSTGKGRWQPGTVAGSTNRKGYIVISIDSKSYLAHRLAWFYVNCCWPENEIDHINNIKSDNRIINLRDVNRQVNQHNKLALLKNNKSGFTGVSWSEYAGKWRARIKLNGKEQYLGYFDSKDEAYRSYLNAKSQNHPSVIFSQEVAITI